MSKKRVVRRKGIGTTHTYHGPGRRKRPGVVIRLLQKVPSWGREELEIDDLVLTDETTAEDVDGWDSLSHIQLVAAMEEAFGIEFKSREILSWDNVGDLIDSIEKKI